MKTEYKEWIEQFCNDDMKNQDHLIEMVDIETARGIMAYIEELENKVSEAILKFGLSVERIAELEAKNTELEDLLSDEYAKSPI